MIIARVVLTGVSVIAIATFVAGLWLTAGAYQSGASIRFGKPIVSIPAARGARRIILVCLLLGCDRAYESQPKARPMVRATEATRAAPWPVIDASSVQALARRHFGTRLCVDVAADAARQAGPRSISCNGLPRRDAAACADYAIREGLPFTYFWSGFGSDSVRAQGIVGSKTAVTFYYADGFGPDFKGTCLRRNVLSSGEGFPSCRRELGNRIDLGTCRPYEERRKLRFEEDWPPHCDVNAPLYLFASTRRVRHVPLVADLSRWNLRCGAFSPSFELIIRRDGTVQCARIVSLNHSDAPPPPGLYEEIKRNLLKWQYTPPLMHGEPVAIRFPMSEQVACTD